MAKRGKAEKWAARSERLAAALRENLKRRKQQTKGRELGREQAGDRAEHGETPAPETGSEAQIPTSAAIGAGSRNRAWRRRRVRFAPPRAGCINKVD
jgi:hypothetical protein